MSELTKQQNAAKKLDDMFSGIPEKSKQQRFLAEKIVEYMKNRISEDEGLAEDVLKKSKSWDGCNGYLYSMAKKAAGNATGYCAEGETILEWAEDYFRKEDKPKKAPDKASKVAKAVKPKNSTSVTEKPVEKAAEPSEQEKTAAEEETGTLMKKKTAKKSEEPQILADPKTAKKAKKQAKEDPGQMSIFDLLGGLDG